MSRCARCDISEGIELEQPRMRWRAPGKQHIRVSVPKPGRGVREDGWREDAHPARPGGDHRGDDPGGGGGADPLGPLRCVTTQLASLEAFLRPLTTQVRRRYVKMPLRGADRRAEEHWVKNPVSPAVGMIGSGPRPGRMTVFVRSNARRHRSAPV